MAKRPTLIGAVHAGFDASIHKAFEYAEIKGSWWGWWLPDPVIDWLLKDKMDKYLRAKLDEYSVEE